MGWGKDGKDIKTALRYVDSFSDGVFGTLTARAPVYGPLHSVYWVRGRQTIFRMPLLRLERTYGGKWWILMEPRIIPVKPAQVGLVRGWRYLHGDQVPADDRALLDVLRAELEAAA